MQSNTLRNQLLVCLIVIFLLVNTRLAKIAWFYTYQMLCAILRQCWLTSFLALVLRGPFSFFLFFCESKAVDVFAFQDPAHLLTKGRNYLFPVKPSKPTRTLIIQATRQLILAM